MAANIDLDKISGEIQTAFLEDDSSENKSRLVRAKDWIKQRRSEVKPWGEFFNTRKFVRPVNASEATTRLVSNVRVYQANYLIICLMMTLYCM